jgi:spore coat protein U-like protein
MKKLSRIAASVLAIAALSTSASAATANGTVNATVEVIAALTLTELNPLDFGQIVSGDTTAVTVAAPATCDLATATTAGLGSLQITNASAAQAVTVDTTFPSDLTDGTNNIPFGTGTATYCDADAGTLTDVTAAASAATLVADAGGNENIIYVGGTLSPAGTEPVGTYANTVDITITY